jgi:hypothetical protein
MSKPSTPRGALPPTLAETLGREERDRRAYTLVMCHGYSARQVGKELGISGATALACIRREARRLAERDIETRAPLVKAEVERIQRARATLWPAVEAGDTHAVREWRGLSQRLALLLGLDAPVRTQTDLSGEPVLVMPVDARPRLGRVVLGVEKASA